MTRPFVCFGPAHLGALALTLTVALGLGLWARRVPEAHLPLRRVLAVLLLAATGGFVLVDAAAGTSWRLIAPLQLCDAVVPLAAWALWSRRQEAFELCYCWGLAGTLPALLTPDLAESLPHYRFILYFAQHGGIVVAALLLAVGIGMRPRRRAPLLALGWLNAYAAAVAVANWCWGTNFMYLCAKPGVATALDWLGPWPWYLLSAELVALGAFLLLTLPYRPWRDRPVARPQDVAGSDG